VEFVDEHDQPVEAEQPADAILVTNLMNTVQPLIRYRVDDRFVQQPAVQEHGHVRATVDGRASDMLRWRDVTLHPLAVTNELIRSPAVVDYIVRQTAAGVQIDVVLTDSIDLDVLAERVAGALREGGLTSPAVEVRRIDDIGRNPHTGKVARIVPLTAG
jgi:phenylacetate-coenzyme A ligase PaaK-like adenylate-forming protein